MLDKFDLLLRTCAAVRIQRFYRCYVKCSRDESGFPIDPILKGGFNPKNEIRILYKSKLSGRTVIRPLVFDIETLWCSIKEGNNSIINIINPITNTNFTYEQFHKIATKAASTGLIDPSEVSAYLHKYAKKNSYSSSNQKSTYEIDKEREEREFEYCRDQNLLAYWSLISDNSSVEQLIYKRLLDIESGDFDINFMRKRNEPLVTNTEANKCILMALIALNRIIKNYEYKKKYTKIQRKGVKMRNEEINSPNLIDLEMENELLPNYLKNYSALHACCISGNRDLLLFLLQIGANVSKSDPETKILPLHAALLNRKLEIVHLLSIHGAMPDQIESGSEFGTPLEIADSLMPQIPDIYTYLFGNFNSS